MTQQVNVLPFLYRAISAKKQEVRALQFVQNYARTLSYTELIEMELRGC